MGIPTSYRRAVHRLYGGDTAIPGLFPDQQGNPALQSPGGPPTCRVNMRHELNRRDHEELKAQAAMLPPPEGKFQTIVIDPPWPMRKIVRESRPNQVGFDYPTMTLQEIADFGIPADIADDDCHLFLWTTQRFLPSAFTILEAWGFDYVFTMVWHKNGGFQPYNLPQYNCEFVLYGRKGSALLTDTEAFPTPYFPTCFNAPRREHSRKPDEFYQMIERVCPGPRIDVFSREKRAGFEQYGIETGKFKGEESTQTTTTSAVAGTNRTALKYHLIECEDEGYCDGEKYKLF